MYRRKKRRRRRNLLSRVVHAMAILADLLPRRHLIVLYFRQSSFGSLTSSQLSSTPDTTSPRSTSRGISSCVRLLLLLLLLLSRQHAGTQLLLGRSTSLTSPLLRHVSVRPALITSLVVVLLLLLLLLLLRVILWQVVRWSRVRISIIVWPSISTDDIIVVDVVDIVCELSLLVASRSSPLLLLVSTARSLGNNRLHIAPPPHIYLSVQLSTVSTYIIYNTNIYMRVRVGKCIC